VLRPERLDHLPADDRRARRSRRDLQRIHRTMRSLRILVRAIERLPLNEPPRRILELGAGDGTLLLRLLCAMRARWLGGEVTLLDRLDLIDDAMRARFSRIGWSARTLRADVMDWGRSKDPEHYDLCIATLFLHHLEEPALGALLAAIAERSDALVACEPRRNALSRFASRLVILLGANAVTRHDAAASVSAGFTAGEISRLWTAHDPGWRIDEYFAWPFSHCFVAHRASSGRAASR
jgi:SAM-dependent methyltransferase